MKLLKKIASSFIVLLVVIQFFHPDKNQKTEILSTDITKIFPVPDDVNSILKKACYDCHSNSSIYPWYSNFQPVAWWMNNHIEEGKGKLNFSQFGIDPVRWQYKKLESVKEEIKEGEMPLSSYTWIHKNAILTDLEKQKLLNWCQAIRDSIKLKFPPDSLLLKKEEIIEGD